MSSKIWQKRLFRMLIVIYCVLLNHGYSQQRDAMRDFPFFDVLINIFWLHKQTANSMQT